MDVSRIIGGGGGVRWINGGDIEEREDKGGEEREDEEVEEEYDKEEEGLSVFIESQVVVDNDVVDNVQLSQETTCCCIFPFNIDCKEEFLYKVRCCNCNNSFSYCIFRSSRSVGRTKCLTFQAIGIKLLSFNFINIC